MLSLHDHYAILTYLYGMKFIYVLLLQMWIIPILQNISWKLTWWLINSYLQHEKAGTWPYENNCATFMSLNNKTVHNAKQFLKKGGEGALSMYLSGIEVYAKQELDSDD